MRIYTDLTSTDLHDAARLAGVEFIRLQEFGSRTHARRFDVMLTGSNPARAQADRDYHAATWDEWAMFLAELFRRDPTTRTVDYRDGEHFRAVTGGRFDTLTPATQHRRHRWTSDNACSVCGATRAPAMA